MQPSHTVKSTSGPTYLARTVPNTEYLLKPLEDVIRRLLLPSISGQNALSDNERDLMALPARLGVLGIAERPISPSNRTFQFG